MAIKETQGERIFNIFNSVFLIFLSIICLYPILYVLLASISDPIEIMKHKGLLFWPKGFSLGSYRLVFQNAMITTGYRNTLIYVTCGTAINMFMTITCAYSLSRKNVFIYMDLSPHLNGNR
jgi:putative aldouronate transport system permease protein